MSEETIVLHCSPTLAGMKTASLFTCPFKSEAEIRNSLRKWNNLLAGKGMRIIPLKYSDSRVLVYVYRVSHLLRDLKKKEVCKILRGMGYRPEFPEKCIMKLKDRLQDKQFPHEIGLFLGYPPEDVQGFIQNKVKCKFIGHWKVYGDVETAAKIFAKFNKCTDVYCRLLSEGRSIERLTVAG